MSASGLLPHLAKGPNAAFNAPAADGGLLKLSIERYDRGGPSLFPEMSHLSGNRKDSIYTNQPPPRRSGRGKKDPTVGEAAQPPAAATTPAARHVPRKQTYEILRAPPELVAAFKVARTEYHDAVHAWWWHAPGRTREQKPTPEDYTLAKLDPWVQRAGRKLDAIDAQLSRVGEVIKNGSTKNDWSAPGKIRAEEGKLDREYYYNLQAEKEHTTATRRRSEDGDTRAAKRRRTGNDVPLSSTTSTTSRSSVETLTPLTTPDPDPMELDNVHPKVLHKQWQKQENDV